MRKAEYHFLVCNSFRANGAPQGVCHRKSAVSLQQLLETQLAQRRLHARVTATACLGACAHGPVLVVYPQGWWYGSVNAERLERILDALEAGKAVKECLVLRHPWLEGALHGTPNP